MFKQDYEAFCQGIEPDPALVEETKRRMRVVLAGRQSRPRPRISQKALAAVGLAAVLTISALAAAPALWTLIQAHLGAQAPYAHEVLAAAADQGLEVQAVAALTDRNIVKVYLTLRDLEGDRLGDLFRTDLWVDWDLTREPGAQPMAGGGDEVVAYDPERRTLTLCETYYGRRSLEPLPLHMGQFIPGFRSAGLQLEDWGDGTGPNEILAAIPDHVLKSAVDGAGRTVLLPNQNPLKLEWREGDMGGLPEGEPGVEVTSIGFAEDGRLHVRFLLAEGVTPCGLSATVLHHQEDPDEERRVHAFTTTVVPVEGGVDCAFEADAVSPEDLAHTQMLEIGARFSVLGGPIEGAWNLEVPLEPVEAKRIPWTGGLILDDPYQDPERQDEISIDEIWLSPLGLTVNYHVRMKNGEWPGQLRETQPRITLEDGTVLQPALVHSAQSNLVGDSLWSFDAPIRLEEVASVTLYGETIPVDHEEE